MDQIELMEQEQIDLDEVISNYGELNVDMTTLHRNGKFEYRGQPMLKSGAGWLFILSDEYHIGKFKLKDIDISLLKRYNTRGEILHVYMK